MAPIAIAEPGPPLPPPNNRAMPRKPIATPPILRRLRRSSWVAIWATKRVFNGVRAMIMAAIELSTLCCPQAISVKGRAVPVTPMNISRPQTAASRGKRWPRTTTNRLNNTAATMIRPPAMVNGPKDSSAAAMAAKLEPQTKLTVRRPAKSPALGS